MTPSTALIVLISTVLGHAGSAVSPVVTFNPNWKKIFIGESMTMTCDVGSTGGGDLTYVWYKDGKWVHTGKTFSIPSAETQHSGNYSCWAGAGRSDTASLDVAAGWVVLRAPLHVHEGDDLTLRCHHRSGYMGKYTTFYKDDSVIQSWRETSELHVGIVNLRDAGRYKCTKEISLPMTSMKYVTFQDEVLIYVHNLFEVPVITATPIPVVEGDHMTLTCDTRLSPLRPRTELKFAFYRDGRNVGEFSSSNRYGVQSAQVKDSGKYSCEVTTSNVQKRSREIEIEINELFVNPTIIGIQNPEVEGDHMTLICDTSLSPLRPGTELQFAFYRDGWNVQELGSSDQYGVQSAQLEDSGIYSCDVRSSEGRVRKSSHFIPIVIKELFSTPVLHVRITEILEGDTMTLTCDTSLSPLRRRTELQFAFYRDRRNVQEFGSSNQYGVQSAQLEDSGNYSCEVRTSEGTVKKSSHFIPIVIKELFSTPVLNVSSTEVLEGDTMTLRCDTSLSPLRRRTELQFAFSRDGRNVQEFGSSDQYGVQTAQLEDSGNYSCDVRTSNGKVKKSSHVIPIVIKAEKSHTANTPIIMAALLVSLLVTAFLLFMYRHKLHWCPHPRRGRQPQISPTHAAGESADAEVTYTEVTLHRVPRGRHLRRCDIQKSLQLKKSSADRGLQ